MAATWPTPAGAYRNAAWNSSGGTAQIILDTVDTGYPYTALSTGTITINRPGVVTITAQVAFTWIAIQAVIRVNGATVATGASGASSTASYTYSAKTGDQIQLWENDGLASAGSTGPTTTFLHVTPAGTRTTPYNAQLVINRATLY